MSAYKSCTVSCQLICLQNSHEPIALPDGETITIGRTPQTKITDARCSRNQVSLTANWTKREVKVTQLGVNNSSVDEKDIGRNNDIIVKPSSTLFVIAGAFPHRITFKSTKKDDSPPTPKVTSKRSHADEMKSSDAKKRKLEDAINKSESNKSEEKLKQNLANTVAMQANDGSDSDEDLRQKAAKLNELKKEALKEASTSSESKSKPSSKSNGSTSSTKSSSSCSTSSSQAAEKSKWTSHDQLQVFTSKGVTSHRKVAAFDMDGTIIVTKSGKVFPTDRDDWQILHPNIFNKMKELHTKGFKIVFFTNQLGVAKGKTNIDDLKIKVANIVKKLQVPVQVFIATHEGKYRKPCDGMWEKLCKNYNSGKDIDLKTSFYVGDAAGREKDWAPKKKKDFSCSDRLFALNTGVTFFTPEEYFLNEKPTKKYKMPVFDPRKLDPNDNCVPSGTFTPNKKELVLLVGFPACGKSFFSSNILKPKGYKIVSR
ncbi:bifunctional polynucleotide phosphatase/kinase, partial [Elysia marginata]